MFRFLVCLLALLVAAPAFAQSPGRLPVQGYLTDPNGVAVTGTVPVTFALYGDAEGTQQFWSETQDVTLGEGGYFATHLGAEASMDLKVFADYPQVLLGVTIAGDSQMPLIELGTVPWAGYAEYCGAAMGLAGQALANVASQVEDSLGGTLHDRYSDAEAVAAMGPVGDGNPLHHNRMSQSDVVSSLGGKAVDNSLNHDRFSNVEAVSAMGPEGVGNALNHARYSDAEAVGAMGPAASGNPLNHARYTNALAVSAVAAADDYVSNTGDTVSGNLTVTGNLVGAAKNTAGTPMRVCSGSTPANGTGWVQYNASGIYINVDTSGCGFSSTPTYTSALYGGSHWGTTGASSVYNETATSFRIYIRYDDAGPLSIANADTLNWHVQWIAVGN